MIAEAKPPEVTEEKETTGLCRQCGAEVYEVNGRNAHYNSFAIVACSRHPFEHYPQRDGLGKTEASGIVEPTLKVRYSYADGPKWNRYFKRLLTRCIRVQETLEDGTIRYVTQFPRDDPPYAKQHEFTINRWKADVAELYRIGLENTGSPTRARAGVEAYLAGQNGHLPTKRKPRKPDNSLAHRYVEYVGMMQEAGIEPRAWDTWSAMVQS